MATIYDRIILEPRFKVGIREENKADLNPPLKLLGQVKILAQARDFGTATEVAESIDDEYYCNEALRHIVQALAQAQDIKAAIKVAGGITDGIRRAEVLVEASLSAVKSGLISAAIDIATIIDINQEIHLYTIISAIIENESLEGDQFKRLLIPCAFYINLACRVCGLLAKVYPNQSRKLTEIVMTS